MENYDVIVIGGGAAGMMAAGTAAKNGKRVILLEKRPVLGKKLLITGKGRCNITNYCDVPQLIENVSVNGKFLTNAFYGFSSYDTVTFFNENGLETKVERGDRVFPASDKAIDVVEMNKGQPVWNNITNDVANVGTGLGFEWGGNWSNFPDYPHFQMTQGQSISDLQGSSQ